MHPDFEAVIGLEVHAQLATESKLFCRCRVKLEAGKSVAEEAVNGNVCEVCSGHPGTLPVLNKKAVELAILAGLGTQCTVTTRSVFSRKNYFYPDLPKGYQISQYDLPICQNGWIDIEAENEKKRIQIQRIHIEEDAGKNLHMSGFSLVNLNRASVPLIEIVSGPDMRTPEEASAYMKALYAIVTYLGVCEGNLQEGQFRCDANVSVRRKGSDKLGTRTETKNVNSFRFVEKAIEYEINRQIEVILSGGTIIQETRGYDSANNKTFSLRSKEEAHDYRYFPEPDLVPLVFDSSWVEQCRSKMPELPTQKKDRYVREYGLSAYDATVITQSKPMALFFEKAMMTLPASGAKTAANLLTGEIARLLNESGQEIHQTLLQPQHLVDLVRMLAGNEISSTNAKKIITLIWDKGGEIGAVVEKEGLKQVSDTGALEKIIDQVIAANPTQTTEFRAGKEKLLGFFVGQGMKASKGQANPALLQELFLKKLKG